MFGTTPPSPQFGSLPDPTTTALATYTSALKRQLTTIQAVARAAHAAYQQRSQQPSTLPTDTLQLRPAQLAMITRPRTHKIFTRNAGPYLVQHVQEPHVTLRSLTHDITLKEHMKNVRPFNLSV